jgi:hypothetical protein
MLRFERQVVAALLTAPEAEQRAAVEQFVAGTLATMPEHLRAGVAAESLAFGAVARVAARHGDGAEVRRMLGWLERSPLMPMRQYVRLFRSLVLFAEEELAPS